MTARKSARKRATSRKTVVRARVKKGLAKVERLQEELPASLDEFSRRMHRQLTKLEKEVERAESRARREIARILRQASHRLGRFEAQGEKQWKKLTGQARREALALLRRLEKRLEPPRKTRRSAPKRKPRPAPVLAVVEAS